MYLYIIISVGIITMREEWLLQGRKDPLQESYTVSLTEVFENMEVWGFFLTFKEKCDFGVKMRDFTSNLETLTCKAPFPRESCF